VISLKFLTYEEKQSSGMSLYYHDQLCWNSVLGSGSRKNTKFNDKSWKLGNLGLMYSGVACRIGQALGLCSIGNLEQKKKKKKSNKL
jgi:hypothetical protein